MDSSREEKNIHTIVSRLAEANCWPYPTLPCDSLLLDIETLGFNADRDAVVQVGLCAVRDCETCDELWPGEKYKSLLLKWPAERFVGAEQAIEVHGITHEKSAAEGAEPKEVFLLLKEAIEWARGNGMMIGGHNFYKFDRPFIETAAAQTGVKLEFNRSEIVDTAMLVKAMQVGTIPEEGESIYSYWGRVAKLRCRGVYFNLDRYCMSRFKLAETYGVGADEAHDAGYDCYLTHLLILELNKIVDRVEKELAAQTTA